MICVNCIRRAVWLVILVIYHCTYHIVMEYLKLEEDHKELEGTLKVHWLQLCAPCRTTIKSKPTKWLRTLSRYSLKSDRLGVVTTSLESCSVTNLSPSILLTQWWHIIYHVILEGGMDLKDHLVPSPWHGQGHLLLHQAAQHFIQPGFEHWQGWDIHNLPGGNLFQSSPPSQ